MAAKQCGAVTDRCTEYACGVASGEIIAGKYVRLACQRHLDDIEKSQDPEYIYYFDIEKSEEIINFGEELTIAEGQEQEHVTLFPFQCFILGSLNGWRIKEKGYRRFRTSYVQLGRQNGKSFIDGILACYYGNFDGYMYGKIYCTATKQDQANIVWEEINKFISSDNELAECFKVHAHNHTIDCLITHSEIKALSGDTKSLDGHRTYLGIVDEYHAHKTNQMYKLLEGGIKKLKSALISVITTAGFDLKSPCYKLYEYCCSLLEGVFENDSQFVYIAQLDEGDDWHNRDNWIKANPILEFDSDAWDNLVPVANTARDMGGEDLRDFLVKQLNMWTQWSNSQYIKDIREWKRCAVLKTLENFHGAKCYVGIDLSSGGDLTSIAIIIPHIEGGVKKYFIKTHSFIPAGRVDEHIKTDKVPYDLWIKKGLVTVTETLGGVKTDYKYIISYLRELISQYELKPQLVCYDPHNASAFLSDIEALGVDSVSITQTARELNDAKVDFQLEIKAGNVEIEGIETGSGKKEVVPADELLTWSIANAKTVSNSFGEIKIDKSAGEDRIDPIDAIIDAWKAAMKEEYRPDANEAVSEWLALMEKYGLAGE
ncbi:MAG: terminase large subunit [Lachnospiraceae bacterium]|nr:terminase large subunit [Lachnospiraceae bacterium]